MTPFHYKPTTKKINVGGALGHVTACVCQLQKSNWWMGGKIEFAELAFWKFNFYLGQQVALLCADKTTAWQLEIGFMKFEVKVNPQDFRKWIFTSVMSISIFNFHKNWMATIYTHHALFYKCIFRRDFLSPAYCNSLGYRKLSQRLHVLLLWWSGIVVTALRLLKSAVREYISPRINRRLYIGVIEDL